jgi:hypothetical protein
MWYACCVIVSDTLVLNLSLAQLDTHNHRRLKMPWNVRQIVSQTCAQAYPQSCCNSAEQPKKNSV